jgi:tetratricopeptide (TPR) repeat protein
VLWANAASVTSGVRWSYLRVDEDLFDRQVAELRTIRQLINLVFQVRRVHDVDTVDTDTVDMLARLSQYSSTVWQTRELVVEFTDVLDEGPEDLTMSAFTGHGQTKVPEYDVFISYSYADREIAQSLSQQLRSEGLTVFLAGASIRPGDDALSIIAAALQTTTAVAVLVSSQTATSGFVKSEISNAAANARSGSALLIPVLLDELPQSAIPKGLEQFVAIRVNDDASLRRAAEQIVDAVRRSRPIRNGVESDSVESLKRALSDRERILGSDHPSTLTVRANLASAYQQLGQYDRAAELLERALYDSKRVLGSDHPSTLTVRANLASVYQQLGQYDRAAELLKRALSDSERALGPDDTLTLTVRANLQYVIRHSGGGNRA